MTKIWLLNSTTPAWWPGYDYSLMCTTPAWWPGYDYSLMCTRPPRWPGCNYAISTCNSKSPHIYFIEIHRKILLMKLQMSSNQAILRKYPRIYAIHHLIAPVLADPVPMSLPCCGTRWPCFSVSSPLRSTIWFPHSLLLPLLPQLLLLLLLLLLPL